jgi:hypothetical protein
VADNTDCNDNLATTNPARTSDPGPGDVDCDGTEAEDRTMGWYRDADGDGWGNSTVTVKAPMSARPAGYVYRYGDCNDSDPRVHPYQATCHADGDIDGDGHRSVLVGGDDCNDLDPHEFPGNPESTDPAGHDEDCDPGTGGVVVYDPDFLDTRPHLVVPGTLSQQAFGPRGQLIARSDIGQAGAMLFCSHEVTPTGGCGLWYTPPRYRD